MMIRYPDFECPECLGSGRVIENINSPVANHVSCDLCGGNGEITAQEMYDHAVGRMMKLRETYHRLYHVNRTYALGQWGSAMKWLYWAKKARSVLTQEQHHGSAHVGSAA